MLNGNIKVCDFLDKSYKDEHMDGWVHIQYDKQGIFGERWMVYGFYFNDFKFGIVLC